MSKGMEIRAQIDAETARGLIQINGGGCVALVALIGSMIGGQHNQWTPLVAPLLIVILIFAAGLICAIVHNYFRRECSLVWESHSYRPPRGRFLWFTLKKPRTCFFSSMFMWGSVAFFVIACGFVGCFGISRLAS